MGGGRIRLPDYRDNQTIPLPRLRGGWVGPHPEHVVHPSMGNGECRHLPRVWGKENPWEVRIEADPHAHGKKKNGAFRRRFLFR
jgi:hypothetical protein